MAYLAATRRKVCGIPQGLSRVNYRHWLAPDLKFLFVPAHGDLPQVYSRSHLYLDRQPIVRIGGGARATHSSGMGVTVSAGNPRIAWQTSGSDCYFGIPASSDFTIFCLIDNIGTTGGNARFVQPVGGSTMMLQDGANRRPFVILNGTTILQPVSGPQWVTGQSLGILFSIKSGSLIDCHWNGVLQHTASHAVATPDMSGSNGMRDLGSLASDTSTGIWQMAMVLHRYVSPGEAREFLRAPSDLFIVPYPKRTYFMPTAGSAVYDIFAPGIIAGVGP